MKTQTLAQALKGINPNKFVYIGCNTGFIFIGENRNSCSYIKREDERKLDIKLNKIRAYATMIDTEKRQKYLDDALKSIRDYVPLMEREVIEVYERNAVEPLGTIIIVKGKENGKYWDYEEFKNDNKESESEDK